MIITRLCEFYLQKGDVEQAEAALRKISRASTLLVSPLTVRLHLLKGEKAEGERVASELIAKNPTNTNRYQLARFYLLLGDTNKTLDLLEESFQRRETSIINLAVDHQFRSLAGDPRYESLIKRLNLR